MRLLLVPVLLLALAVPAASAERAQRGDGTLSIRDGRGTVVVRARGAVIGSIARLERGGKLVLEDAVEGDGSEPIVRGADWVRERADGVPVYGGKGIRFRLIGGRFFLNVTNAVGLQLSVVGRGTVTIDGAGSLVREIGSDGVYSLNGEPPESLPDHPETLALRPPAEPAPKTRPSRLAR